MYLNVSQGIGSINLESECVWVLLPMIADYSQLCSHLAVFRGEFWSFRYFKDTDLRETQQLKQEI